MKLKLNLIALSVIASSALLASSSAYAKDGKHKETIITQQEIQALRGQAVEDTQVATDKVVEKTTLDVDTIHSIVNDDEKEDKALSKTFDNGVRLSVDGELNLIGQALHYGKNKEEGKKLKSKFNVRDGYSHIGVQVEKPVNEEVSLVAKAGVRTLPISNHQALLDLQNRGGYKAQGLEGITLDELYAGVKTKNVEFKLGSLHTSLYDLSLLRPNVMELPQYSIVAKRAVKLDLHPFDVLTISFDYFSHKDSNRADKRMGGFSNAIKYSQDITPDLNLKVNLGVQRETLLLDRQQRNGVGSYFDTKVFVASSKVAYKGIGFGLEGVKTKNELLGIPYKTAEFKTLVDYTKGSVQPYMSYSQRTYKDTQMDKEKIKTTTVGINYLPVDNAKLFAEVKHIKQEQKETQLNFGISYKF